MGKFRVGRFVSVVAIAVGLSWATANVARAADPTVEVKAATKIEKYEPVDPTDKFKVGDTVFVWTRIKDAAGTEIKHVWKKDGKDLFTATLPVKSKDWHTRSRREKISAGSYTVEVQDSEGKKLGEIAFTVENG